MSKTEIITLGCRLNFFESEIIRGHSVKAKLENSIIINTCAVTGEAERQARQTIRRVRRENPNSRIIVTGCAAQLSPRVFSEMPEIDLVIGNEEKLDLKSYTHLTDGQPKVLVSGIMGIKKMAAHEVTGFEKRSRAFVQVQQGCNHRCTFCIIPFARGNNRSLPEISVVRQVRKLVQGGFKEIVLTGVDICSYGVDYAGKPRLGKLIQKILANNPTLVRLRLSSLDPASLDSDFFNIFKDEERLMPHLHFSLQSMDDMVLKRMKRRHSSRCAEDIINKARLARPEAVFGADIIAGFPTETSNMFVNTIRGIKDLGITYLHVFPYSERSGTPAAKMPAVTRSLRKERATRLREISDKEKRRYFCSLIGTQKQVLVEKGNGGFTKQFAKVMINAQSGQKLTSGDLVNVEITGVSGHHLEGSLRGRL